MITATWTTATCFSVRIDDACGCCLAAIVKPADQLWTDYGIDALIASDDVRAWDWDYVPHTPETIEEARARVKAEIRSECESHINAGFISSAVFPDANYRNDRDKQKAIERRANNPDGGDIWLNEDYTPHTQAQAQQVHALSESLVDTSLSNNATKQKYLSNLTRTIEEINAVTWASVES